MTTTRNGSLFQPAAKTERYLKVLLHGVPGTGKTLAALSFPGPLAVIDLEGGTALYEGDWAVLRTKDLRRIEAAIDELGRGGTYRTVVIDPLTVLWQVLQDAGQGLVDKRRKEDSLESGQALSPREWGIIKRRYSTILTRLINLPLHVVLIARDTDLYEGKGDQLTKVGTKPDVEKATPYVADFVLWCQASGSEGRTQFSAVVEKSRSPLLPIGQRLTGYGADAATGLYARHFARVAGAHTDGGTRLELEEETTVATRNTAALESDLTTEDRATEQQQAAIRALLPRAGMTEAELLGKMGVAALADFTRAKAARVIERLTANARERQGARLISAADLSKCNAAAVDLGWGDTDVVQYLQRYGVRTFVELSPEQAAEVVPDLVSKAAEVQGEE